MSLLDPYAEIGIFFLTLVIVSVLGEIIKSEDLMLRSGKARFHLFQTLLKLPVLAVVFLFILFDELSKIGLTTDFSWERFLIAFVIGFFLLSIVIALRTKVSKKLGGEKKDANEQSRRRRRALMEFFAPRTFSELTFQIIYYAFFFAGIGEEIVFRGFLQNSLKTVSGNLLVAVMLQALVFAMAHWSQGLKGVVTAFSGGLIFSFAYVFSGTLVTAIFLHAIVDSMGFTYFYKVRKRGRLDKMVDRFLQ